MAARSRLTALLLLAAACALVAAGWRAADAIGRVRLVRHPEAVENPAQEAFVRAYERHMAVRTASGKVAP